MFSLNGKKAPVACIASDQSVAWGSAKARNAEGADPALTCRNDTARSWAGPDVRPLAGEPDAPIIAPLKSVTKSLHALSPDPVETRAAPGIGQCNILPDDAAKRAPTRQLVMTDRVGAYAGFPASDQAARVTGGIHSVDGGYHIMS